MSKRPPVGNQVDAINRNSPFVQISLDLNKQDQFAKSFGVDFTHYQAQPSPIGKNDRGSYRRNDGVDTITSNGMIYTCAGKFLATMIDNTEDQSMVGAGLLDYSQCRIVMPRYYTSAINEQKVIYLSPGDRIYLSDPDADVNVAGYQEMEYEPNVPNITVYPIEQIQGVVIDSRNMTYTEGLDFRICDQGNIIWLENGKNPGIDPTTGKGRIYSVRYLYRAHWYVLSLPKEIRVTGVTENGVRTPERMPYHAILVREWAYHNQNRGDAKNQNKSKEPARAVEAPSLAQNPNKIFVPVDMSTISEAIETDEQS